MLTTIAHTRARARLSALALAIPMSGACVGLNPDYRAPQQDGGSDTSGDVDSDATMASASSGDADPSTTAADATDATTDTTTGADPGAVCGDGVIEGDEQCDAGEDNGVDSVCTEECKSNVCGDGTLGPGESCDDGNTEGGDGCDSSCALESCGNGVVEPGEDCDDGNAENTDACTNSCTAPACGDGFVQDGEACDDGNGDNADACTVACTVAACGDGFVQDDEACDDGNDSNLDACTNACALATCGDGYTQPNLGEACDDGNDNNEDACTVLCAPPECGDGFTQMALGEGCDDADDDNVDACTNLCHKAPPVVHHGVESETDKVGNDFNDEFQLCGDGKALVGLQFQGADVLLVGKLITRIRVYCATLDYEANGQQWVVSTGPPTLGVWVGLNGTDDFEVLCNPDHVVTALAGRRASGLFKRLQARCSPLMSAEYDDGFEITLGPEVATMNEGYGSQDVTFGPLGCPEDSAATGIAVGVDLDGLGSLQLKCHTLEAS